MKTAILKISLACIIVPFVIGCNKESGKKPVPESYATPKMAARGKGFTKKSVYDDKKGVYDCTNPGSSCKVSVSVDANESAEIATVQNIIVNSSSGNGNAYFNTNNWDVLFDEVNDMQGVLASIQGNTLFLYEIPSADGSGTTYGYSYVLSTAINAASVNDNNTMAVWQY